MEEFEEMREVTKLSLHPTCSAKDDSRLRLWISGRADLARDEEKTFEVGEASAGDEYRRGFDLSEFLIGGHLERQNTAGEPAKKVGVAFKNITVKGVETGASFVRTLPDTFVGTFGSDLYRIFCRFVPVPHFNKPPSVRDLLHDFSGAVREGEMMLVLGRPGAGCSTFLKTIANDKDTFATVEGVVMRPQHDFCPDFQRLGIYGDCSIKMTERKIAKYPSQCVKINKWFAI